MTSANNDDGGRDVGPMVAVACIDYRPLESWAARRLYREGLRRLTAEDGRHARPAVGRPPTTPSARQLTEMSPDGRSTPCPPSAMRHRPWPDGSRCAPQLR